MIFIDSNVPMYLIGSPHRHKVEAQDGLERLVAARQKLVTSTEVLQEILHRYSAIGRLDAIQPAFDLVHGIVDEILSIEKADVELAKTILLGTYSLSARDALHVAVMERRKIGSIFSFDRGFDNYPGIERIG